MAWVWLMLAGLLEVCWTVGLKYTEGFTRPVPTAFTVLCMAGSMFLLGLAVRELPIGTAHLVWAGIGGVGAVIMGIALFGEPADGFRLLCLALILGGIAGLKTTATR